MSNHCSHHLIQLQPRSIKLAPLFWRLLEALKIDLQTKVGWVLKTSGNSPFVGHWNFSIWTKGSKDNWVKRELGSQLTLITQKLGCSLQTLLSLSFFVIITKFQCALESWWQEDSKTPPTLEYYSNMKVLWPSKQSLICCWISSKKWAFWLDLKKSSS